MKRSKSTKSPAEHTVVISDPESMFWKMAWDIQVFDDLQRGGVKFVAPLAYAAINVCIAATSLRDWTVKAFRDQRSRDGREVPSAREVCDHIYRHVLQQQMCEAIASTAKHASFAEREWVGGAVCIEFNEPDEDDPGGYILRHIHQDGAFDSIGLNAFRALERNWWGELQNLGFPFPANGADWWQDRVNKILGDRRQRDTECEPGTSVEGDAG